MAEESSSEKTEEATDHKKQEAKKKGNIANSKDMTGFVVLTISLFVLFLLFKYMLEHISNLYIYYTDFYTSKELAILDIYQIVLVTVKYFLFILLPISLVIMVSGVIGNVSQFGFLFSAEPLKPKISKINPIAGLKRLFSIKIVVNTFKMVFQVSIIFIMDFILLWDALEELPEVTMIDYFYQLIWLRDKALIIIAATLGVMFVFAIFDLAFTRQQYNKDLKMTKQEVKDELKNIDGNPEIKARIRKVQMEMARERMMKDVAQSDVVITNPTHYAIAILYDFDKYGVPIVSAKGVDHMALKIKAIATEYGVPIVENKPLAQELYKDVKLGQTIPASLYKAVAKILSYVQEVSNKNSL